MVNKNLCRSVVRKCLHSKTDLPPARVLSEPKCHNQARIWYLVYRWLIFLCWTAIVICSVFELGSVRPKSQTEKWPIYLTNWDLVLGTVQALLGAILVTRRWRQQRRPGFDPEQMVLGRTEKIYWFLYVVTSTMAVGVTITYWVAVHDPRIHQIDPLNILLHVCNSILMLLDLFVSNVPFRIRSFWWAPLIVLFYLAFSLVYYASGGVNKRGEHYIYKVLDWEKPQRTLLVCIGGLTFVVGMHCILYFMALLRDLTCRRMCQKKSEPKIVTENDLADIINFKKTEIIV